MVLFLGFTPSLLPVTLQLELQPPTLLLSFTCAFTFVLLGSQIAGAVSVIIGALVEVNGKHVLEVLYEIKDIPPEITHLAKAGYLLIAVGAVLTVMGFLGCCGACYENKCMLGIVSDL